MNAFRSIIALLPLTWFAISSSAAEPPVRWSPEKADAWYSHHRWIVGSNFSPASAINQLEMWQPDTFDPTEIDKELGWAEGLGMNTMRVFLHDLLWQQDAKGFQARIDQFLTLCAKHHIQPLLVLFDSCWDPNPALGPQHAPVPGVHNSGWVQSPGTAGLTDNAQHERLKDYVTGVVGAFAGDDRVLGWDLWNEPDNRGGGNYTQLDEAQKIKLVAELLPQVFVWARSVQPVQPLTSGLWHSDNWSPGSPLNAVEAVQLDESDIISFHSYDKPKRFLDRIEQLQPYARPMLCTEYMARGNGSTFAGSLPIARAHNVGMINWGFVVGKTQTNFPWDSWEHPYVDHPPAIWFHDIFQADGKPYRTDETDLIKKLSGEATAEFQH